MRLLSGRTSPLALWTAVHQVPAALMLLALGCGVTLAFGGVRVHEIGPVVLPASLPMVLMMAIIPGHAAAVATVRQTDGLGELRSGRARDVARLRAGWILVCLAVACVIGSLSGVAVGAFSPGLVTNIVLFGALGCLAALVGWAEIAWLPATLVLLGAILFGSSSDQAANPWGALVLSETVGPARLGCAVAVVACAVVVAATISPVPRAGLFVARTAGRR